VFCSGSIIDAFVKVGLLTSTPEISHSDTLCILKKYITLDLAFHPISARQLSRYVQSAMDTLYDVFLNDVSESSMPRGEIPLPCGTPRKWQESHSEDRLCICSE